MALIASIIELISQILRVGESLSKVASDQAFKAWMSDLEKTVDTLEKSTSLKEKVDAAKKLNDLCRRLG